MSASPWSKFIGYVCAVIYSFLAVYLLTGLAGVHNIGKHAKLEDNGQIDPDSIDTSINVELVKFTRKQIAAFVIKLLGYIIMTIASVLLIVGVKQQRHSYMAPWVYLCGISVLINTVLLLFNDQSAESVVLEVTAIIIAVAVWYPVFKHYSKLKNSLCSQTSTEAPAEKCMMNPSLVPLYDHVNAYPCAPPAAEFCHATATEAPPSHTDSP